MDNLIKKTEMFLQVFIQNYNHCENSPCKYKRINDVGITLIRSVYSKTYHLKEELYLILKALHIPFCQKLKE